MVDPRSLIIPVLVIAGSFVAAYATTFLLGLFSRFTSRTKITLDDEIFNSIRGPIRLVIILAGIFYAVYLVEPDLKIDGISIVEIYILLAILVGAYFFSKILTTIILWYTKEIVKKSKSKVDDTMFVFLSRIVSIIIYVIAIMVILSRLGIEISPLLASLGIAGLAVALALQDSLSNFFSAIYLTVDKPIKLGDYIELENGLGGYVDEIGWRSTKIKTLPNNYVIIPNSKLSQTIFTNYSSPVDEMSVIINVGVAYSSDLKKVEKVTIETVKKVMQNTEGGVKNFEPFIRYNTFGDSSIDFSVILRVRSFVDQYLVKHEFVKALHEAYRKNKIEIPFPQRDVHLSK